MIDVDLGVAKKQLLFTDGLFSELTLLWAFGALVFAKKLKIGEVEQNKYSVYTNEKKKKFLTFSKLLFLFSPVNLLCNIYTLYRISFH